MTNFLAWRRHVIRVVLALSLSASAPWTNAAPVCVDPEGAIGGTGAPAVSGAIGGTGLTQGAVGGTGNTAGAVGGTGNTAGAVGGTGAMAGAIGGTGVTAGGGIGGTGAALADGIGGTGIVGTITGFASVCVSGLEVHYDAKTPVSDNGMESSMDRLAVGQVVAIEAVTTSRGLQARGISVLHALAGPVTGVQAGHNVLTVMGQAVSVGPTTRVASGGKRVSIDSLHAGAVVKVSGYRNASGEVVASRIDVVQDLATHSAIGIVHTHASAGFELDGMAIRGAHSAANDGAEALVRGRWNNGHLVASEVSAEPTAAAIGRAEHLVLEGIVRSRGKDGLSVGEFSVQLSPATRVHGSTPKVDERVRVIGRVGRDRSVQAESIGIAPSVENVSGDAARSLRAAKERDEKRKSGGDNADTHADNGGKSFGRRNGGGHDGADGGRPTSEKAVERSEHKDAAAGRQQLERSEKVERPDKIDQPEKSERPDPVERPTTVDRPVAVERPEPVDRPDKPEVQRTDHD